MQFQFSSADGSMVIGTRDDSTQILYERGMEEWDAVLATSPAPYVAPALPDPIIAERAAMTVSRFQALAALLNAGLLSQVNVALADAGPLAQLAWAEATEFRRNSPTIAGLAAGLGLTDTEVDDLFRAAALITA